MQTISWIKNSFSLNHTFFINGEVIGFIKDRTMSKAAKVSILGRDFVFETTGFFRHTVNIIDLNEREIAGNIRFSRLWPKAKIEMAGTTYSWKRTNILSAAWKIVDPDHRTVVFSKSFKNGSFQSEHSDDLLLMITGIFINYKMGMQ